MRITVAAGLCVIVAACAQVGPPGAPAASAPASPTADAAVSGPRIAPPPVTPPTPPGTTIPAFACADTGGGKTGVSANVTAVRASEQIGYDRFVLQFDGPVPKYTVIRQNKPTFSMGASGQTITLSGTYGALVTVTSATEANTYSGPTDLSHPEFLVLKEARLTQDFKGNVSWGIGLDHYICIRSFTLINPARLVVDFATSTS